MQGKDVPKAEKMSSDPEHSVACSSSDITACVSLRETSGYLCTKLFHGREVTLTAVTRPVQSKSTVVWGAWGGFPGTLTSLF